ncbi:MAG TPA: Ig-like domain-containing protein [Pseudonocardiaceae bacterium]|jgi:lipoprotein-anchoring transpeptidase ErfK/SrfK
MQHGNSAQNRHRGFAFGRLTGVRARKAAIGVVGLAVAGVMLAACSSGSGNASGGSSGGSGSQAPTTTAGPPVNIAIANSGATTVNPGTPVVVKATNGTLKNVAVTNTKTGAVVTGAYSTDKTSWTSTEDLAFGATYAVDATGANPQGSPAEQKATMTTISPSVKSYTNMFPAPASVAGTGIGVGMPIIFQFSHPVTNKQAVEAGIKIATTPSQAVGFYWISSTELDARPQAYWTAGTKVHVMAKLYGTDLGGGNYDQEDRDETYTVHDAWIAKADGSSEQMQIFDNGAMVKSMSISMGKGSTPTSLGPHVITDKNQSVQMNSCTYGVCPPDPRAYNETEYWAERITNGGEFVHENPATVGVQGHSNVSHGCINLNAADAQWFFTHLGVGDVVEVTNSSGPMITPGAFIGDWAVPWSQFAPVASA